MEQLAEGIKGIIFELDSVLFDKSEWVLPATEFAAQQMRLDPQRAVKLAADYIEKNGGADPQIYNAILLGCGQFDTAMNIRAFTSLVNQFQPASRSIQLYPGVEEALLRMRDSLRLAVVTDGPPDTQKRKVIALGLNELIKDVIYSDEIEGIKSRLPDPRPLLLAASNLRLRPEEILFVGHNPVKHFQRTKEIGFLTMRVLSGEYGRHDYLSEEHRADFDMPSVASLMFMLNLPEADGAVHGDQWGEEKSWPIAAPREPEPVITVEHFASGTQFEDAAFAALFQMTAPALDPQPPHAAPEPVPAPDPLAEQSAPQPELAAMPAHEAEPEVAVPAAPEEIPALTTDTPQGSPALASEPTASAAPAETEDIPAVLVEQPVAASAVDAPPAADSSPEAPPVAIFGEATPAEPAAPAGPALKTAAQREDDEEDGGGVLDFSTL